jgi:hypothetical protein
MSLSPFQAKLGLSTLALLPLTALSVYSWQRHRDATEMRANLASLSAEEARLKTEVATLTDRRSALQQELTQVKAAPTATDPKSPPTAHPISRVTSASVAPLQTAAKPTRPAPAVTASSTSRLQGPSGPHGNVYFSELFDDPHYAQVYRTWLRQRNEERYAPLFASLSLSPTDLARLKDLLVQKEMSVEDVEGVLTTEAMLAKKTVDAREVSQTKTRVIRAFDEEIRQTFGSAVWVQYQGSSARLAGSQEFLDQLTLRLSYSPAPLASEQITQLSAIYNTTRQAAFAKGDYSSGITDAFVADAQTILNPDQVKGLLQIQTELRASHTGLSTVSIRQSAPATPPPRPPAGP